MRLLRFKSKKQFFALLIFFLSLTAYASCYNITFVHLGSSIPPHIFTSMKQARHLNQNCDIYLISDEPAYNSFYAYDLNFFSEENIVLINMEQIPNTKEHLMFSKINTIDPDISEGLWLYSLERFFYLFDFIRYRNLKETIHLESDSMLYIDLDELMPHLQTANIQLAAPFQSYVGCIPCFVFIKDESGYLPLLNHILSEIKNSKTPSPNIGINDMQILASFYQKLGASHMTPLPTLMPEYSKYHTKRRSLFQKDNTTPLDFLSLNESLFPGYLFDAAALGIFVNGNDRKYFPHNGPKTIHYRSLFDPGFFLFFWDFDSQKRKVPYLSFKGKSYRIINMHFHSKMLDGHTSYKKDRLEFPLGHCL